MPEEPREPGGAPSHQPVELGRGVEARLVGRDQRDQAGAVRIALAVEPVVERGEPGDGLGGERRLVVGRVGHELPGERRQGRLHRAGGHVARAGGGCRRAAASGGSAGARRSCGARTRRPPGPAAACAARRAPRPRLDAPQRDGVPARVPGELRRELVAVGAVEPVAAPVGGHALDAVAGEHVADGAFEDARWHHGTVPSQATCPTWSTHRNPGLHSAAICRYIATAPCSPAPSASARCCSASARCATAWPVQELPVCELCADEAEQLGWRREGDPAPPPVAVPPRARPRPVRAAPQPPRRAAGTPPGGRRGPPRRARARPGRPRRGGTRGRRGVQLQPVPAGPSRASRRASATRWSPSCRSRAAAPTSWSRSPGSSRGTSTASTRTGGMIRLEGRGDDPDDLDERWRRWNAHLASDGRLAIAS